jgi:hypothetical protein
VGGLTVSGTRTVSEDQFRKGVRGNGSVVPTDMKERNVEVSYFALRTKGAKSSYWSVAIMSTPAAIAAFQRFSAATREPKL